VNPGIGASEQCNAAYGDGRTRGINIQLVGCAVTESKRGGDASAQGQSEDAGHSRFGNLDRAADGEGENRRRTGLQIKGSTRGNVKDRIGIAEIEGAIERQACYHKPAYRVNQHVRTSRQRHCAQGDRRTGRVQFEPECAPGRETES
jgi:hypothetical protein